MERYTVSPSPLGDLLLTASADGESLTGLYLTPHRGRPETAGRVRDDGGVLGEARRQLAAYFAGELREFDLPLAPRGTPFQLAVWTALRAIPYAQTRSYGQLAVDVGNPAASRAVGLANGRNPISIIVPCHRVIGANGKLVGYGGGVENKRLLLALEGHPAYAGQLPVPAAVARVGAT